MSPAAHKPDMTTHKNQVGQDGAGVNGGEFAARTRTDAPEDTIPTNFFLNSWAGAGAFLLNDVADQVIAGAVAIRIRENDDDSRRVETTFPPVDLEEHIGDTFAGSDMGDTTEEWIEEHEEWVRAWFRDHDITIVGDWPQAVLIHNMDLPSDAETFRDVSAAFNASLSGPTLRDAVSGDAALLWDELEFDINDQFCRHCFGFLTDNTEELCDTCQEED